MHSQSPPKVVCAGFVMAVFEISKHTLCFMNLRECHCEESCETFECDVKEMAQSLN
jgi:hypothetical protein